MSLRYRMTLPVHDNSAVATRQVLRQRERLAKKRLPGSTLRTRSDEGGTRYAFSSSKYRPHQGKREMARRVRQLHDIASLMTRSTADRWRTRHAA